MTHNADFLFISHYTGVKNGLTHYQDSYFGEMVNQLCQNGKSSVVAYINESKSNASNEVFQKKSGVLPIVLSNITSFFNLIKILKNQKNIIMKLDMSHKSLNLKKIFLQQLVML